jgi:hypothetical protein
MTNGATDGRRRRRSASKGALAVCVLAIMGAAAPAAQATLRVINHNEPAGDPTAIGYRLSSTTVAQLVPDFMLVDGEPRSFGPGPGTYTIQALVPAGWQVGDIQCVGPSPADFAIDVPNGRVTMVHGQNVEQTCAFTNRRASASVGGQAAAGSGVAPAVPASELSKVTLPKKPALVRIRSGRRYASATVRITRRSVIKAQLLSGKRVVGSTRVTHQAGTYVVRVNVARRQLARLRAHGHTRATLTLKVVIVAANKATSVFRYRAIVRL